MTHGRTDLSERELASICTLYLKGNKENSRQHLLDVTIKDASAAEKVFVELYQEMHSSVQVTLGDARPAADMWTITNTFQPQDVGQGLEKSCGAEKI